MPLVTIHSQFIVKVPTTMLNLKNDYLLSSVEKDEV